MARRDAVFCGYPLSFEQREFGEANENWIERAGLQSRFAAQLITIAPGSRTLGEPFKHAKRLGGYSRNLHYRMSTYIDIMYQESSPALSRNRTCPYQNHLDGFGVLPAAARLSK